ARHVRYPPGRTAPAVSGDLLCGRVDQPALRPGGLQSWMAGGAVPGQVKGLALGAITPFCSCSTIPMFVSMLKAGVAFRTTVTYLIASPLLNPIIVGGIWLTLSWQVAISYAVIM